MITSWSHSKLVEFEKCKRRVWLLHDAKIPEPKRPLRPGQLEHANDRGTRVHNEAELFVRGQGKLKPEMKHFEQEFMQLAHLYSRGKVSLEGEWGVDLDWNPCDWKTAWHRSKIDALVRTAPEHAVVIDYKTGKKFGNEIKHNEQLQIYTLNAFLRYPELEVVDAELWYLDIDDLTRVTFTRSQALRFKPNYTRRGMALTTCTEFPPNPNVFSCKWCMYGPWGSNDCPDGVQRK